MPESVSEQEIHHLVLTTLKELGISESEWTSAKQAGPAAQPEISSTPLLINSYIDHTLLKPEATTEDIHHLCSEASEHQFASVCVNSCHVSQCATQLAPTSVTVCSVVGFPLGAASTLAKADETSRVVADGGTEIDMVLNIGKFKSGDLEYVSKDIYSVVIAAQEHPVKVILETGFLSTDEIIKACILAISAGATFVKTSTGFGPGGATEQHIRLMRNIVGPHKGVKASGGVRDKSAALAMIAAGANRIGTSSGISIITGSTLGSKY